MPRTRQEVEQRREKALRMLAESEKNCIAEEWARFPLYALVIWFLCFAAWHTWPYLLNPTMWPKTQYALWLVAHVVGYVGAVLGAMLAVALLLTGGKVLDRDWTE